MISILIVSYNTRDLIEANLSKLDKATFEIIVIDNASMDGTALMIQEKFPEVICLALPKNIGFGPANNIGAKKAKGDLLLLLNPDAFATPEDIKKAAIEITHYPQCGVLGAQLISPEGENLPTFRKYPNLLHFLREEPGEDWITGAFMMIPKKAFEAVGGFDEQFFLYYEEVDLCRRLQEKGYTLHLAKDITITHLEGQSAIKKNEQELEVKTSFYEMDSALKYFKKWHGPLGQLGFVTVEGGFHLIRYLKHALIPGGSSAKKEASKNRLKILTQALFS